MVDCKTSTRDERDLQSVLSRRDIPCLPSSVITTTQGKAQGGEEEDLTRRRAGPANTSEPGYDYLEPFVGMGHVLRRVVHKRSYAASDANPLVMRLQLFTRYRARCRTLSFTAGHSAGAAQIARGRPQVSSNFS